MATRIYVGNLPYSATEQQLMQLFATYGDVSDASIVMDRDTGRSKGFGFLQMEDDDAARTAITELNGTLLDNRALRVDAAAPRPDRNSRGGNRPYRESRW